MTTTETVDQLPLGRLHAGENIRRSLGDIAQLAASIESTGIHEPLIVRPLAGPSACDHGTEHWQVVAGHRRLAAATRAGLDTAPCIVRDLDDDAVDDVLAPLDEATGLLRLVTRGMTIKDLAARIGRTQKHVSGRLELLNLHSAVAALLDAGDIGLAEAHALGEALDSDDGQYLLEQLDDDAVQDLVARIAHERNPSWLLAREATSLRQQELREQIVAAAAAGEGPPLVERVKRDEHDYGGKWSDKVRPLEGRKFYDAGPPLGITAKKHAGEPCHAVTIDQRGGLEPMCSDWHRHKPDGDGIPSPEIARAADQRAESKQAAAQQRAREKAYNDRIAALVGTADPRELITLALQHGARQELGRQNAQVTNRAAEILDLEYGPDLHTEAGDTYGQASHSERALQVHAEASQAGAVRVLTVLALVHWRRPDGLVELLDRYAPEEG